MLKLHSPALNGFCFLTLLDLLTCSQHPLGVQVMCLPIAWVARFYEMEKKKRSSDESKPLLGKSEGKSGMFAYQWLALF